MFANQQIAGNSGKGDKLGVNRYYRFRAKPNIETIIEFGLYFVCIAVNVCTAG